MNTAVANMEKRLPAPTEQRRDFAGTALVPHLETAATAVAAQSKAMVESRYIMAMQRPRNWDQCRQDLIKECSRPSFANDKSAYYRKPIGQGVEGLGIRFVEVALRCMKNVFVNTVVTYEDDQKRIMVVSVTDLESNLCYDKSITVTKTVERSKPMDDGSYVSVRMNTYGKAVYTVPATDDDLLNKEGSMVSKVIRTLGLRLIPGDMQDECETIIKRVRMDDAAKDPDAAKKAIADAFAGLGVTVADLEAYLGHSVDKCAPAELVDLRGLYGAIRDSEATWKSAMENKAAQPGDGEATTKPTPEKKARGVKANEEKSRASAPPAEFEPPQQAPTGGASGHTPESVLADVRAEIAKGDLDMAFDLCRSLPPREQAQAVQEIAAARETKSK